MRRFRHEADASVGAIGRRLRSTCTSAYVRRIHLDTTFRYRSSSASMRDPSCECMVTFMARPVAQRIKTTRRRGSTLQDYYVDDRWRAIVDVEPFEDKMQRAIAHVSGSRWRQVVYASLDERFLKRTIVLLHFTNHPEGRREFKRKIWTIDRDGTYVDSAHR